MPAVIANELIERRVAYPGQIVVAGSPTPEMRPRYSAVRKLQLEIATVDFSVGRER
jgi:hypothetical protein